MYARKVVLLQILKYLPSSIELAAAVALNDAAETGGQGLTVKDAIEGTWVPVDIDEETPIDIPVDITITTGKTEKEPKSTVKTASGISANVNAKAGF